MTAASNGAALVEHVPDAACMVGRIFAGRYRVVEQIGSGGVSVVYRAEHMELGRQVALKVLHTECRNENWAKRFEREAKALAALTHPHIVTLIDYGMCAGKPFLVMELLEGVTLRQLAERGDLDSERAFRVAHQVLGALAFAHFHGLVHRDLKPDNVFLQCVPGAAETVKLLDFGFAKFVTGDDARDGPPVTRVGTVMGTPAYMTPEQVTSGTTDLRTDVYGVGVLLFEMLAGRRPFEGDAIEILKQKVLEDPPRLSEVSLDREIPPALDALLAKAISRRPAQRFANAIEMLEAFSQLPRGPLRSRSTRANDQEHTERLAFAFLLAAAVLGGVVGGVAMLVAGLWLFVGEPASFGGDSEALITVAAAPPEDVGREPGSTVFAATGSTFGDGRAAVDSPRTGDDSSGVRRVVIGAQHPVAAAPAVDDSPDMNDIGASGADPWSDPELPGLLRSAITKVDSDGAVSGSTRRALRAYARRHRNDGRPHLLLGHSYLSLGRMDDAVFCYRRALRVDSRARRDPRLLANLLSVVAASDRTNASAADGAVGGGPSGSPESSSSEVGLTASALVVENYGRDALTVVDQAMHRDDIGHDERARLQALRAMLIDRGRPLSDRGQRRPAQGSSPDKSPA